MKLKLSNSYIKGYHIYHVRPHADISMEVESDFDNEYDEFAMKVSMPDATKVKAGLLDAITRPEKQWYRVWRFSLTVYICVKSKLVHIFSSSKQMSNISNIK